jgi:predicted molibdopterin-dependent oxidoreductase YjgC
MIRKDGQLHEVTWDEAFNFIATRLKEICEKHGPDSIALLNSPRCSNEESYLLQKLARAVIKTNNVDHGAGVYSNNSTDVLLEMIGVPATPILTNWPKRGHHRASNWGKVYPQ